MIAAARKTAGLACTYIETLTAGFERLSGQQLAVALKAIADGKADSVGWLVNIESELFAATGADTEKAKNEIRAAAVAEDGARGAGSAPIMGDVTRTDCSFGLRGDWIQRLEDEMIKGSGKLE